MTSIVLRSCTVESGEGVQRVSLFLTVPNEKEAACKRFIETLGDGCLVPSIQTLKQEQSGNMLTSLGQKSFHKFQVTLFVKNTFVHDSPQMCLGVVS